MPATINRRLVRLTAAKLHSAGKTRGVVVEFNPDANGRGKPGSGFIGLRLSGTRTTYYLPVDWCFREAVRNELARTRAERKRQREERRNKLRGGR